MKQLVIAAFLLACVLLGGRTAADTPLDVFGVEKSINDAARRAQETGDTVARAFADQALKVIAAWKEANQSLINSAIDGLDNESKKMFTGFNNFASRIERGEAVSFIDLQQVMVTAGGVIDRLPGTSKEPAVSFHWPTIIIPGPIGTITIRVLGTKISNANPRVSTGSSLVSVKKADDNQVSFDVVRSSLVASESTEKNYDFRLKYDVSKSVWFNPISWWSSETRERDVSLTVLPSVPGTVALIQTIREESWDYQRIGPLTVGGVGKDNQYRTGWGVTPLMQEQGWIVDKEKQEHEHFDDNGGDGDGGSSCSGYDPGRFSDIFVGFNIQHGHNGGGFSGTHDAHQNCRIWVHLKKKKNTDRPLEPEAKPLSWTNDVDFTFDQKMVSYKIVMKLYTGVSYNISSAKDVPYSLFDVLTEKSSIKFRPRPQRDF